jgi:hypothetical protein
MSEDAIDCSLIEKIKEYQFKHGSCYAVCIQDVEDIIEEHFAYPKYLMPDGRKIFGEDSQHDIGEHIKEVCAEQSVGCYSPEHIEAYLFGGKKIDHIVDGMTYNLTGTHLKDILQNYRKLWGATREREVSNQGILDNWQPIETAKKIRADIRVKNKSGMEWTSTWCSHPTGGYWLQVDGSGEPAHWKPIAAPRKDNEHLMKWAYLMLENSCPHVLTETVEGRLFEDRIKQIEGEKP